MKKKSELNGLQFKDLYKMAQDMNLDVKGKLNKRILIYKIEKATKHRRKTKKQAIPKANTDEQNISDLLNSTFEIGPGESSIFAPDDSLISEATSPQAEAAKTKIETIKEAEIPDDIIQSSPAFQKALHKSVERLIKSSGRRNKQPNLEDLHAKLFARMESIDEYQDRKKAKLQDYETMWEKHGMLRRSQRNKQSLQDQKNDSHKVKTVTPKMSGGNKRKKSSTPNKAIVEAGNDDILSECNVPKIPRNNSKQDFHFLPSITKFRLNQPLEPTTLKLQQNKAQGSAIHLSKDTVIPSTQTSLLQNNKHVIKNTGQKLQPNHTASNNKVYAKKNVSTSTLTKSKSQLLSRLPQDSGLKKRLAYDPKRSLEYTKLTYEQYKGPVLPLEQIWKINVLDSRDGNMPKKPNKKRRGPTITKNVNKRTKNGGKENDYKSIYHKYLNNF